MSFVASSCVPIRTHRWLDWLPLAFAPLLVMACSTGIARWERMWLVSAGVFFGFKWLTWTRAVRSANEAPLARSLGYLFAWPDMDPRGCLDSRRQFPAPKMSNWLFAAAKLAAGLVVVTLVAPRLVPQSPLMAGWVALVGLAFVLHFGLFHLLALCWQRFGFDARPIMACPVASRSLAEFWGRRWNVAFRQLAHGLIFQPLAPRIGNRAALVASFVFSGFWHEIAISLPAGAGFGLPMTYFVLQAVGMLFEHSSVATRWNLNHGALGRVYAAAVVLLPVGLVFHRPFIFRIVLPMLHAITS